MILRSNEILEKKVRERTLELARALEREKSISEMKLRFITMASHEFRTPLSTLLSSIFILEQYMKPGEGSMEMKHFKKIKLAVTQVVDILNDFISLDKLENGEINIDNLAFDLNEFAQNIIEEIKGISKKGQTINYRFSGEASIFQDQKILKNIIYNLLSNAVKFSEEGKEILLEIKAKKGNVFIKVEDKGIGIPKNEQKYMFGRLFRAKNAVNISGTGLGLNIVKYYLDLIGGSIDFISEPGKGTAFSVRLPANAKQN